MTISAVLEQCIGTARALGWSLQQQNELAARVVRKMRPQWSESQITYSIVRARAVASNRIVDR